jgi:hypothetical protein
MGICMEPCETAGEPCTETPWEAIDECALLTSEGLFCVLQCPLWELCPPGQECNNEMARHRHGHRYRHGHRHRHRHGHRHRYGHRYRYRYGHRCRYGHRYRCGHRYRYRRGHGRGQRFGLPAQLRLALHLRSPRLSA